MWPFLKSACAHRKRLLLWSGVCLSIVLVATALCFFAPFAAEVSICRICGKQKSTLTVLGVKWYTNEFDTELSDWYHNSHLRSHPHEWVFLCSTARQWGGQVTCYDSFGFELSGLRQFQEASAKMDQATLQGFAREYDAIQNDPRKSCRFFERLEKMPPTAVSLKSDPDDRPRP